MKKRQFLRYMGNAAMATPLLPFSLESIPKTNSPYPDKDSEAFWERIRKDYKLKPDYINLESGYYNIIPTPILEKYTQHIQHVNYEGSYYMRTVQWDNKKKAAARVAELVNCSEKGLIITRNTTESLDTIIGGYPWEKGDEAIFAVQDYGAMQVHFHQMEDRYGIVCKKVSLPNHPESDEEIVSLYESQITPKTRLLMICHMVNVTGQILPVRKICDMAHSHGVEVMVDGAHCVGHIKVDLVQLDCDYYGSSLHKWLCAPLGAGMLYVAERNIPKIWPLLAEHEKDKTKIRRLNHTGTHPVHTDLTINDSVDYLEMIGLERKENRMRFLQRYWSDQLRDVENVVINTPIEPHRSCGIANVGLTNIKPSEMAKTLLDEFNVWTVAIDFENVHGCRITPNVFTTTEELDQFVDAIKTMAKRV
ncbi:aminotransferase class V-fold PLP-dependent enzyme [Flagellimonas okinawensis]|uniref:Aminotransferase class V-fold PLP-dependent enzyme n=1 Tax=Flagellimonas okinawensis TaxID=3031324 RepID=A0ABT5XN16_9FLAO|nr:aminotransferase class V-fold PLP-dependent enzyme [[Muricauda] okinawensis]MDF0707272.1 aminotransferase class V-fold PLP-dependent enzyme [[Muricauda] okinawensis]